MPLSDATVRKAKPADKAQRLFDGGGLYLEVSPAGGRLWRFKYRYAGKEKRLSLGTYPDTGLADARAKHAAARKLLAAGIDLGEQRKAETWTRQESFSQCSNAATIALLKASQWLAREAGAAARECRCAWLQRRRADSGPRQRRCQRGGVPFVLPSLCTHLHSQRHEPQST